MQESEGTSLTPLVQPQYDPAAYIKQSIGLPLTAGQPLAVSPITVFASACRVAETSRYNGAVRRITHVTFLSAVGPP